MRQYELRAGIPTELQNSEVERPTLEMGGLCRCEIGGRERFETGGGERWEAAGVERFELPAFLERWSRASSRITERR